MSINIYQNMSANVDFHRLSSFGKFLDRFSFGELQMSVLEIVLNVHFLLSTLSQTANITVLH